MNKKYIKIIVSILIIVLLIGFGLGIFGYKKIKNRNNDSKVIENNNNLKAVDNLITLRYSSFSNISINKNNDTENVYFIYKIYVYQSDNTVEKQCYAGSGQYTTKKVKPYNIITNLYVAKAKDKIENPREATGKKLKSSWIIKDYPVCNELDIANAANDDIIKNINMRIKQIPNSYYFAISFNSKLRVEKGSATTFNSYRLAYTKVFNIETGDMIYEIPTNNLEIYRNFNITKTSGIPFYIDTDKNLAIGTLKTTTDTFYFKTFTNASGTTIYNNNLYYLEANYNKKDEQGRVKLDVHEVTFGDNVDLQNPNNKYKDKILSSDDAYDVYAEVSLRS